MNPISKELRHAIAQKVSVALKKKDNADLNFLQFKYKTRIDKIQKYYDEYNAEMKALEKEISPDFEIKKNDGDFEIEESWRNHNEDEIVSKIVVQLQYSKEPDFLKLIDILIAQEIPEKKKVTV